MWFRDRRVQMDDNACKYDQHGIRELLLGRWAGRNLKFYNSTDSTNDRAREMADRGAPHGTLIVSDMQTAGRGRRGRSWESPAGTNIYFTLVLRPSFAPDKASMLTLVMAHAVSRSIARVSRLNSGIKWPNDIVVDGRKVCGILTEMSVRKDGSYYVVVGVGVNVKRQVFAPELCDKAISLEDAAGRDAGKDVLISRGCLLAEILKAFEEDYENFVFHQSLKGLLDSYHRMLVNLNTEVRVLDPKGEYCGIARGITETGELLVETASREVIKVYAGEVSVRGVFGYAL